MQVHHILPHIHEEASGPSYSVPALCRALAQLDTEVTLHVLEPKPETEDEFCVSAYPQWKLLRKLGISPAMQNGLYASVKHADLVHNHSLWMMPNVYCAWASRRVNCPLVIAPRGTVEPWALQRSYWRKRLVWSAVQQAAVKRANCLHATSESELNSIRDLGLTSPIAVIPNGIDIPSLPGPAPQVEGLRRLLFLSRIHPKKGLANLLKAWGGIQHRHPEWELRIVGRDQGGHADDLKQLASSLSLERVSIDGPVYGEAKANEYQRAELFVLPTHSENFGIVVAESLAHGTPVICTTGAPWSGLDDHQAGWWIEGGVGRLSESLDLAMRQSPSTLANMGMRGRLWMKEDFGWHVIAQRTRHLYEWLLGGGPTPDFVNLHTSAKVA